MPSMRVSFCLFLFPSVQGLIAQATATLRGTVRNESGVTLPMANVSVPGTTIGTVCDD